MKNYLLLSFLLVASLCNSQNNYERAWELLNKNNREEAEKLLQLALQDPLTAQDAYITSLYIAAFNGKGAGRKDFAKNFYDKAENPYPYLYALWFQKEVVGEAGKKTAAHQLQIAKQVAGDEKAPGTLVASANYHLGLNEVFSNKFDNGKTYFRKIGGLQNWQYVGPFENLSESGFDKNYGPLQHPEADAVFYSLTNAPVKWFTPAFENEDSWIPLSNVIYGSTAVSYAQTFVTSPAEQNVVCAVGYSGSIKVWVNDELVIAESKERVTDFDASSVKCNLKKGINRVLVQVGYTNSNYPNFSLRFTDENFKPLEGIKSSNIYSPYVKATNSQIQEIPHFAEKFFQEKIAKDSSNLLNYMLLADTYLRSKKLTEARAVMEPALKRAPINSLLLSLNASILTKENNTTILEEVKEKLKRNDSLSLYSMNLALSELFKNQQFSDLESKLNERTKLYGEDELYYGYKMILLGNDKKYDDIIKIAEKMYKVYPENVQLQKVIYEIKKQ